MISVAAYKAPVADLHPVFETAGADFVLLTNELARVPKKLLNRQVASLSIQRDEIIRALGILLTGF
jgi:hypothetical protein